MEIEIEPRQTVPLALLTSANGVIKGRTRMMKLAFLAKERLADIGLNETIDFEFYPYDYGPFSKVLLNDLEWLEEKGAIRIKSTRSYSSKRYDYILTELGDDLFEILLTIDSRVPAIKEEADVVIKEHGNRSTREMLDFVYDEYPEYQEKSAYY